MKGFNTIRQNLHQLTPRLLVVCLFASLGGSNFGYDNGWWGSILGAPAFNSHYGTIERTSVTGMTSKTLSTPEISLGAGIGSAGLMVGCMIAPLVMSRYGRRWTLMLLGIISVIGPIIQLCSSISGSYPALVVGKLILSVGMGIAAASIPAYLAECCPSSVRGLAVNSYSVMLNSGYLVSVGVVYAVVNLPSMANWMIPIALQLPIPITVVCVSLFLPESPRWLVQKGRLEEASQVTSALEGVPLAVAQERVTALHSAFVAEQTLYNGNPWIEIWRGANRRRTLIAIGIQCIQQAQGISFVASYLVLTFNQLGFTNSNLILVGIFLEYLICSCAGFILPDYVGRRPLLLWSASIMTVCMMTFGGIAGAFPQPTGSLASFLIAAYVIWMGVFAATWSGLPWIVCAEVSSQPLRETTLAVAAWCGFAVALIINFVVPYIQNAGYGDLQGRIAFIWGGFSIVSVVYVFFFVPETGKRSLEELDIMFESRLPTREFAGYDSQRTLGITAVVDGGKAISMLNLEQKEEIDLDIEAKH